MKTRKIRSPEMESKRKATSDLNHDNWDRDEEPEEKGSFQVASFEELRGRVIKKARRKVSTPGDETTANKSVFSAFAGFSNSPSTASAAPTAAASPFSFLSKISSTTSTPKTEATVVDNKIDPKLDKSDFKPDDKLKKDENSFGFEKANSYYAKLKGLNQEVSKWIKSHVDKNPLCILTPIFKDYEKYLEEIKKNPEGGGGATKPIQPSSGSINTSPKTETIKFGLIQQPSNSIDKKPADSTLTKSTIFGSPSSGFSFTTKAASTTMHENKSTNSNVSSPTMFSFGLAKSTTETKPQTSSNLGFSFTSNKPFTFTSNITKSDAPKTDDKDNKETEDEDAPPKVEFKPVVEEDSVYTKKCKVFVKGEKNYAERGVGTLYVKPIKDSDKKQLLIRADTNLGNILLNIILSDGIPTQRLGKNNVMMICIPTPESDPKPTPVLLRVKTSDEADELQANIEKYKK